MEMEYVEPFSDDAQVLSDIRGLDVERHDDHVCVDCGEWGHYYAHLTVEQARVVARRMLQIADAIAHEPVGLQR